jgi:hypothetical protein
MSMIICDKHGEKLRGDDCPYCRVHELEQGIKTYLEAEEVQGWRDLALLNLPKLLEKSNGNG